MKTIVMPEALALYEPMASKLRALYAKNQGLTDDALAMAIEKEYGNEILGTICIPNGLYMGACLVIAVEVAKGPKPVGLGMVPRSSARMDVGGDCRRGS